jgi:transcriptional regulator NrdR family protein
MATKDRPYKCPYCGSTETHWKGYRARADGGRVRIRRCNGCKRKFTTRRVVEVMGDGDLGN